MELVKEIALGITNRHHFCPIVDLSKFYGISNNTFMSLWDYEDNEIKAHVKSKRSIAGYKGKIYMPDEFILDIDGANINNAKNMLLGLLNVLDELFVPYNLYFSGTGFHAGISATNFKWEPCDDLHLRAKEVLTKHGVYEYADPSVTDKTRLIRMPHTLNTKSGYYKIQIHRTDVEKINEEYLDLNAIRPSDHITTDIQASTAVFDLTVVRKKKMAKQGDGRNANSLHYPCIQRLLQGAASGSRHQSALVLTSHIRERYPEDIVRLIMEDWRKKVDNPDSPFTVEEMDKIIGYTYEGGDGSGYRYGCNHPVKDKFCSNTCKLYKSKVSRYSKTLNDMEEGLNMYLMGYIECIDIGKIYNKKFPCYSGEVMIITAPPESMKSMLLFNWAFQIQEPILFYELEMSEMQVGLRMAMIESGLSEEELMGSKYDFDEKLKKRITFEYESCYPWEIQKKVQMLDEKPQFIFVDHAGLMKSKYRDENPRDKDISKGLMDLAKNTGTIVIAIWETTKKSFHDGLDIASPSGSFRIAYNANKMMGIDPQRNGKGEIEVIALRTIKNRELDKMNVNLVVNTKKNGRIGW